MKTAVWSFKNKRNDGRFATENVVEKSEVKNTSIKDSVHIYSEKEIFEKLFVGYVKFIRRSKLYIARMKFQIFFLSSLISITSGRQR